MPPKAKSEPDDRGDVRRFCEGFLAERAVVRGRNSSANLGVAAMLKDEHGFALPPTHPYPGLRAFTTREARMFFGRQNEADELRRRLSASNVVVVLGGSGSGKSSLVLAGVLPRLNDVGRIPGRTGRWYAATFRPGDSPCARIVEAIWNDVCAPLLALNGGPQAFAEILFPGRGAGDIGVEEIRRQVNALLMPQGAVTLAGVNAFLGTLESVDERLAELRSSLRSGPINFLLLIDQFEELFRDNVRNEKKADIETIIDLLEDASENPKEPLVIIATLRSEELHRCAEFDRLAPIVNHGFYLIDHPKIGALMEAAVKPGRQTLLDWDVRIEDDNSEKARALIAEGKHAPFAVAFLEKLRHWVERFQGEDRTQQAETEQVNRHQADFLPLYQHLLRITWSTAVNRWQQGEVSSVTIEPSDIESWVESKRRRVAELRQWLAANGTQIKASSASGDPDNMLELCFDTGFAITISEAITGQLWDELETWPETSETMKRRLRILQAALVALATRDDKGNDARRPATADEILAASAGAADRPTLQHVLSFFKARNYLRGGDNAERYDVNHEALIRNSTEYQAWLADAKRVANALYDANAALAGGTYGRSLSRARPGNGWQNWWWQRYSNFTLRRFYEAAERLSGDRCRDLERLFGASAVFDPFWMAERAEIPGTREEQRVAVANIKAAWENAHRWRVDFSEGQSERPSLTQRLATFVKRIRNRISSAPESPGNTEVKPVALSGRELLQARIGLAILLVPLFLIATPALGYLFSEVRSNKYALEVLAVTADVAYPRLGSANDHVRGQILTSGRRIEDLRKRYFASTAHQRDLTLAAATFDVAARSYLEQIYFNETPAGPAPNGRPLSCIRFDGAQAVGGYDTISSPTSNRKFAVAGETEKRLVPKAGDIEAEIIRRETPQVLSGQTIACGVLDLNYLIVWTQLADVSNPLVYPVKWFHFEGRDYAKIDQPLQPRNIAPALSPKITAVGNTIARSLDSTDLVVTTEENDRSHWVVATITLPSAGSFQVRFARGVQSPLVVPDPAADLGKCEQVTINEFVDALECRNPRMPSSIGVRIFSKGFDRDARTGEAAKGCGAADELCVHKILISHSPSVGDNFKVAGAEINYLIAPPIRQAGLWNGYLVLKDSRAQFRAVPIEMEKLLGILDELPGPSDYQPTTTCEVFACKSWDEED